MEKMTGKTLNITDENIKVIAEHFPEAMEEGKIKFDVLKELLGEFVDESNERYQFTWNGKSQALKLSQTPSTGTLLPCKEKSKNWDKTENLYIEGDNLEVLKLLQKSYYKKIKMIYIDPPYNTGNDFIYEDDFEIKNKNYKDMTSQNCKANPEVSGRYHTDWLNMMFSRLKVAKNLLRDDGVICISIDDNELYNLKKICDEIFGENNFVNCIVVKSSEPTGVKMTHAEKRLPKLKEYILMYKKNENLKLKYDDVLIPIEKWGVNYKNVLIGATPEEYSRIRELMSKDIVNDKELEEFDLLVKSLKMVSFEDVEPNWKKMSEEEKLNWKYENAYRIVRVAASSSAKPIADEKAKINNDNFFGIKTAKGKLYFIKNHYNIETSDPNIKLLFAADYLMVNPCDFWYDIKTTRLDQEGMVSYNNGKKPLKLLKRIISLNTSDNDIILDFFSGSSTTAHATMDLNAKRTEKRKYIMVQIDENLDISIEKATGDNKETIKEAIEFLDSCHRPHILSELGLERIIRSGNKIKEETNADIDYGFKVFKLDSSNLKLWNGEFNTEEEANNYFLEHLSPLVEGRTNEDLLYELLLKEGMPLTSPIEEIKVEDKTIYSIGMGYLIICLEDKIDMNLVEEIGKRKPESIIFRDSGFADENVKINTIQELKKYGIAEEVIKSI